MKLNRIVLHNVRNLAHAELWPNGGLNLIVGPNAAGKSNLCEAIYYAAKGALLKGNRQRDIIAWSQNEAALEFSIDDDHARIYLNGSAKIKTIELNHEKKSQNALNSALQALIFTPDELQVLKGSPDQRRRFLDRSISDLSREYHQTLIEYEQILRRKNTLLCDGDPNSDVLEAFNEGLSERGARLILKRRSYTEQMNKTLPQRYERISGHPAKCIIIYETVVPETNDTHTKLAQLIKQAAREEMRRGTALIGPHRDDVRFELDEHDLRRFGSQGEQKSALCAVLLAQLDLHYERFGEYPILILDDVLSELDSGRMCRLLQLLPRDLQIFLTQTVTDDTEIHTQVRAAASRIFLLKDGHLSVIT